MLLTGKKMGKSLCRDITKKQKTCLVSARKGTSNVLKSYYFIKIIKKRNKQRDMQGPLLTMLYMNLKVSAEKHQLSIVFFNNRPTATHLELVALSGR